MMHSAPPLHVDPSSHYVREVLRLTDNSTSRTVSYGTDGCRFTELRNLILLGPGDIAQAHTSDEWISLNELQRGTELFVKLIEHWCCGNEGTRHE